MLLCSVLRVISQFIDNAKKMPDVTLLVYITKKQMVEYQDSYEELNKIVKLCNGIVKIQFITEVEKSLYDNFFAVSYFIVTRHRDTVKYTCLADLFGIKCVSGVDEPICFEICT